MPVPNFIRNLHKTWWGWSIAIISSIVISWAFFTSPKDLKIELLSVGKVFDLNADVPGLDVTFDGTSLKATKQALSVYSIRFHNTGEEGIEHKSYDFEKGIGIKWSSGKVFPPQIVQASQTYLKTELKPSLEGTDQIRFEPVSIDGGASFVVQALVLHAKDIEPQISPIGKITNIDFDGIKVVDLRLPDVATRTREFVTAPMTTFLFGAILTSAFLGAVQAIQRKKTTRVLETELGDIKKSLENLEEDNLFQLNSHQAWMSLVKKQSAISDKLADAYERSDLNLVREVAQENKDLAEKAELLSQESAVYWNKRGHSFPYKSD